MTMKRVLLKGEFFAEWDGTLDEAAALAGVPVSDLAFHPDDLLAEVQELRGKGCGLNYWKWGFSTSAALISWKAWRLSSVSLRTSASASSSSADFYGRASAS
ncbi:hypothetical protein [Pseudomonas aeruginosa]|uniref:hypothetical protein n=1 Tax=Pseudomonas aeruginosa TaxID=287 RepID=UPI0012B6A872|nr:hypothetical protein [Pseudomonas aeruginosa]